MPRQPPQLNVRGQDIQETVRGSAQQISRRIPRPILRDVPLRVPVTGAEHPRRPNIARLHFSTTA